jgi:NitT/TauT family transport system ATP-binding protein
MTLTIKNLNKSFGDGRLFHNFSLTLEEGTVTSLLGPSGCGKTTFLNMLSGVEPIDTGDLQSFKGKRISYIFQEPRLLPWKTVLENLSFVLKAIYPHQQQEKIILDWLARVGLSGYENQYPKNLSGGMKQRVAIARAFAVPSDLLLMDEPFKGLDAKLKVVIMDLFLSVWKGHPKTVIFVTHDIEEAVLLGQRICVLSPAPVQILKDISVTGSTTREITGHQRMELIQELKEIIL